ncbi:MAG: hypothetical protein ACLTSX_10220 [Collinsella sp.]
MSRSPTRSRDALVARAEEARREQAKTGIAPELLAAVAPEGRMLVFAAPDEHLCGTATLRGAACRHAGPRGRARLGGGARLADALAVVEEGASSSSSPTSTAWWSKMSKRLPYSFPPRPPGDGPRAFADGLAKLFK